MVSVERQPAALIPPLVQLAEHELEERQHRGILNSLVTEEVVQSVSVFRLLESNAPRERRLADELADLGRRRRLKVVEAQPLLQLGELRDRGEWGVEVAPQRGDHPGARRAGYRPGPEAARRTCGGRLAKSRRG